MKGLIIQLAGREPSQDRRGEGVKEKKKKKSKNLVVLLRPGPSSPMLCSSCKRTSQNKSRMPRAILLSAHTPAPPIHTNLCGISLLTSSLLCARSVRCLFSSGHPQCLVTREARGRVWPCRLAERSSTFLRLLIELSHVDWNTNNPFVNSHVWLKSRMDTADGSGIFERGGGPSVLRYMRCARKNYLSTACTRATAGQRHTSDLPDDDVWEQNSNRRWCTKQSAAVKTSVNT